MRRKTEEITSEITRKIYIEESLRMKAEIL